MFEALTYKRQLRQAFSDCFEPLKSVLGNVPVPMQKDRYITASILGTCRGYAEAVKTNEKTFASIVDAVFEEVYRQNSIAVQTLTEAWLADNDDVFMAAYYNAKSKASKDIDLAWLQRYAQSHFDTAFEVNHST